MYECVCEYIRIQNISSIKKTRNERELPRFPVLLQERIMAVASGS